MLTKVILEGPMGKKFGREWAFDIGSPAEALRMVDANKPGVFIWIKSNLTKYANYRVVCEYESGRVEELDKDTYTMNAKASVIRFVPLIEGAGATGKMIAGAVLFVVGAVVNIYAPGSGTFLMQAGASMFIGGLIEALSPRPKKQNGQDGAGVNSSYFDGPANTETQGAPVPLIYGRVKVGAHAISAAVTVDQLL